MSLELITAHHLSQPDGWTAEALSVASVDEPVPALILNSPPLAELHRFNLALFIALEEASLQVASILIRNAPVGESLYFAARQTFDDARHLEAFGRRLDASLALPRKAPTIGVAGRTRDELVRAVVVPQLREYLDRCRERAESGDHLAALTLLNLALKAMAGARFTFEIRYWTPIDPYLARLIREVAAEEEVHVHRATQLVRGGAAGEERRAELLTLCDEARTALRDIFSLYIRRFVGLFEEAAGQHPDQFVGAEFAPGRPLLSISDEDQIAAIETACDEQLNRALVKAGLVRQSPAACA